MKPAQTLLAASLPMFLLGAGCTARLAGPDLGPLYDRAAMHHDELRNPVIVIPGILGSKLKTEPDNRVVWGAFSGGSVNPETPAGARIVAHPIQETKALRELRDDVVPNGVLDRVQVSLIGLPLELRAYMGILGTLGVGGYRDETLGKAGAVDYGADHYTCFQFDYDWRRDNVENARRLHEYILEKRGYVQAEIEKRYGTKGADVKFDVVAHSMGGLIARYYAMYGDADLPEDGSTPKITWAGAKHLNRVILVGTPNAGSVKSFVQLVNGATFASFLPAYDQAIIGSMPSVYQLMPRTRNAAVTIQHGGTPNLYDPDVWVRMKWGLASPDAEKTLSWLLPESRSADERRGIAVNHLRKCLDRAKRFHDALDATADAPSGLELHLFAADSVETDAAVAVLPNGRLRVTKREAGDGTVLRSSALMDERTSTAWQPGLRSPIPWRNVNFVFSDHLGMTTEPVFTDNLLFLLLEEKPRP